MLSLTIMEYMYFSLSNIEVYCIRNELYVNIFWMNGLIGMYEYFRAILKILSYNIWSFYDLFLLCHALMNNWKTLFNFSIIGSYTLFIFFESEEWVGWNSPKALQSQGIFRVEFLGTILMANAYIFQKVLEQLKYISF